MQPNERPTREPTTGDAGHSTESRCDSFTHDKETQGSKHIVHHDLPAASSSFVVVDYYIRCQRRVRRWFLRLVGRTRPALRDADSQSGSVLAGAPAELESGCGTLCAGSAAPVPRSHREVLVEAEADGASRKRRRWGGGRRHRREPDRAKGREVVMPTKIVPGNRHLHLRYRVRRGTHFQFEVEASRSVTTYLVDAEGLADFRAGEEFAVYAGQDDLRYHDDEADIPFTGFVWLIILNDHVQDVAVHYKVFV